MSRPPNCSFSSSSSYAHFTVPRFFSLFRRVKPKSTSTSTSTSTRQIIQHGFETDQDRWQRRYPIASPSLSTATRGRAKCADPAKRQGHASSHRRALQCQSRDLQSIAWRLQPGWHASRGQVFFAQQRRTHWRLAQDESRHQRCSSRHHPSGSTSTSQLRRYSQSAFNMLTILLFLVPADLA